MAEKNLQQFMADPLGYFDASITQMHSIDQGELEKLQRAAMQARVADHIEHIEMVRNLAARLGITGVEQFDDVVPLFFAHTAFKSYPAALIDKKRWDLMTQWLQKQTTYDLTQVDVSACEHEVGAGCGQVCGDGGTDAAGAADHDDHLLAQSSVTRGGRAHASPVQLVWPLSSRRAVLR